jgi:hypothetical protein
VVVTLEPVLQDVLELSDEDLKGAGLTAEEIAASPEIGAWADDDIESGAEYVEKIPASLSAVLMADGPRGSRAGPGSGPLDAFRVCGVGP